VDEEAFRAEARAWLSEHVGPYRMPRPSLPFGDVDVDRGRAWQRELHAGGWAGLGWPTEHGGRGLPASLQAVWAEELGTAGAPPAVNLLAEAIVGPAIIAHGTRAQQARLLPPILTAEQLWCQLFSEPGAGSDLAAVATTARADGDGWMVDGHKTWSSGAHHAGLGLLLARTGDDRHGGLTCFLIGMRQPGVSVQPVRQMTGGAAFDDVILHGARVDDADRLGPVGGGWAVAMTTLAQERLQLGLGLARTGANVDRVLDSLRGTDDPHLRQLGAQLVVDARCARHLARRAGDGPEAALAKLASARVSCRYDEVVDAMRGAGAMLVDEHTPLQLWLPATRIAGGTDEVLKNVIAERVLGLPRGG
jgi:alkylation response protein AidB-like acyl-CoA dehydrogenase